MAISGVFPARGGAHGGGGIPAYIHRLHILPLGTCDMCRCIMNSTAIIFRCVSDASFMPLLVVGRPMGILCNILILSFYSVVCRVRGTLGDLWQFIRRRR